MRDAGVGCYIWKRKELESYLFIDSMMSRVTGASTDHVSAILAEITESMYEDVLFDHVMAFKQDFPQHRGLSDSTIGERFAWLRELWRDPTQRLWRCPAKVVWTQLNHRLQKEKFEPISLERAMRSLRAHEVPDEMASLIRRVNRRLTMPTPTFR